MLLQPIEIDAALKETFELFRQDPYNNFVINVRRTRAEQICKLLSNPSSIDLRTFTDEVWNFETRTFWRSQDMPIAVFKETKNVTYVEELMARSTLFMSERLSWPSLEHALVTGDLELHGNYILHQSGKGYNVHTKDEKQKLAQIQAVVDILNSPYTLPTEKAKNIRQVNGFGENNANGLVMIFHNRDFSLVNDITRKALNSIFSINISASKDLYETQSILRSIKEGLGADDFLELDWFLYLIKEGKYLHSLSGEASNETWLAYIVRVLQNADEPLSYTEIAHRAIALGLSTKGKTPAQTASRILTTHAELFEKVDRGIYRLKSSLQEPPSVPSRREEITTQKPPDTDIPEDVNLEEYVKPPFEEILRTIENNGIVVDERILSSYYISLELGRLTILAGPSGTGKTWLAEAYAKAIGAAYQLVPVAPNWTTNEDLLGYADPLEKGIYHDTSFSSFLAQAAQEYEQAKEKSLTPRPYHVVLDEMNLARVEHYFAKFLSAMEVRTRDKVAYIELGPQLTVSLYPNLCFIGTVNIDETTHGFADKIYDRAQVIELTISREGLLEYIGDDVPYRDLLMRVWDDIHEVAPFAFRVVEEIQMYIKEAENLGVSWKDAVDDQILQKVLPKCNGTDPKFGSALERLKQTVEAFDLPRSNVKVQKMLEGYQVHGFSSYF